MSTLTLIEAVNKALHHSLTTDPKVVVFGEDVGKNGGVFRATEGLASAFPERVFDTPLAENMIVGLAVGLSTQGFKAVAEIQFMGFLYAGLDQLISHATRLRNRTRGRLTCPLVLRMPYGAGIHAPEHHSESVEAMLAHIPGLRVVIPSSPASAYGLLLAAIQNPDPVVFLEPTRLYRKVKQEMDEDGVAYPLDMCFTLREGTDVTVVSWGALVLDVLEVAEKVAQEGISVEVIDVATIKPLDFSTIHESVKRTGRCVIVQESVSACSVASEIAGLLAQHALTSLMSPVKVVSGYDTIVPLYKLEDAYLPSQARILAGIYQALEYA